jgi:hypothetical protein
MIQNSLPQIIEFISDAALPAPPSRLRGPLRASEPPAQHKAAVVGSSLLTFEDGVPALRRETLLNSSLLAQLVANKTEPGPGELENWYDCYFQSLSQLGFVTVERSFTKVQSAENEFSAHSAILSVAAAFLGETTSAYILLFKALKALRQMDQDSPWIQIFRRETRTKKTAKMQLGAVTDAGNGVAMSLMAFELNSTSDITQILFFRSKQADVTFRESHAKTAIDGAVLDGIQPALQKKLLARAADFIFGLPDL